MRTDFSKSHPKYFEALVDKYYRQIFELLESKKELLDNIKRTLAETKDKLNIPADYVANYPQSIERAFNSLEEALKREENKANMLNLAYTDRIKDNLHDNFQTGSLNKLIGRDKEQEASVTMHITSEEGNGTDIISFKISPRGEVTAEVNVKNPSKISDAIYLETPAHWKLRGVLGKRPIREHRGRRQYLSGVPKYTLDAYSKVGLERVESGTGPDSTEGFLTNLATKIKDTIGGEIIYDHDRQDLIFVELDDSTDKESRQELSLFMTATGIVQLGVLGYFINNHIIDKGTILLIDEPEAHLHTEWQAVMMEVLYALKEYGVKVILATHGPTIMQQLEVEVTKRKQQDEVALNLFAKDGMFGSTEDDFNKINKEIGHNMNRVPYEIFMGKDEEESDEEIKEA